MRALVCVPDGICDIHGHFTVFAWHLRDKGFIQGIQIVDGNAVELKRFGDGVPGGAIGAVDDHAQGCIDGKGRNQFVVDGLVLLQAGGKKIDGPVNLFFGNMRSYRFRFPAVPMPLISRVWEQASQYRSNPHCLISLLHPKWLLQ